MIERLSSGTISYEAIRQKVVDLKSQAQNHRITADKFESESKFWEEVLRKAPMLGKMDITAETFESQNLTPLPQRRDYIIKLLRDSDRELSSGEILDALEKGGMRTTASAHHTLLSRMSGDKGIPIERGMKIGFYRYNDQKTTYSDFAEPPPF